MGIKAPLIIETAAECAKCGHHLNLMKADAYLSTGSEFLPNKVKGPRHDGDAAAWETGWSKITQINVSGVRLAVEPCKVCMKAAHDAGRAMENALHKQKWEGIS